MSATTEQSLSLCHAAQQGWLGAKDNIIHTGEGPVPIIRWAGTLVAWANKVCVRVHAPFPHLSV